MPQKTVAADDGMHLLEQLDAPYTPHLLKESLLRSSYCVKSGNSTTR
jgi:hypothetical protein